MTLPLKRRVGSVSSRAARAKDRPNHGAPTLTDFSNRPETDTIWTSYDVGRYLRVHPRTVQRLVQRGELSAIHVGKLWRFRKSDVDAWIENKLNSPQPSVPSSHEENHD
jgi:excisionase family DNA binding protein